MPFTYRLDEAARRVVVTLSGEVSGQTIIEAIVAYLQHPDWRQGYDRIWDSRATKILAIHFDELRRIWALLQEVHVRVGPGRAAVVTLRDVDRSAVAIIKARTPWPIEVFSSMEQAAAWLAEEWKGARQKQD